MNNSELSVIRVLGKDLTESDLNYINEGRKKEFNSKSLVKPEPSNDDWNKQYFLVKNDAGEVLSFGRLHEVNFDFNSKQYSILGIATIVSLVKGKGYGSMLMNEIKKYGKEHKKTLLGFCNYKLSPFYINCGFDIVPASGERFFYKDPTTGNLLSSDYGNDDVICLENDDHFLSDFLENKNEKVMMSRRHW